MFDTHLEVEGHHFFEVPDTVNTVGLQEKISYEFDGHLLVVEQVCALKNDSE